MHIYYFNKIPTIGYCNKCLLYAIYHQDIGLHCPCCKTTKLSIFTWDKESEHPDKEEKQYHNSEAIRIQKVLDNLDPVKFAEHGAVKTILRERIIQEKEEGR